jgi:hypothetical protein
MTPVLEKHTDRLFETGDSPTLDDLLERLSQSLAVRGNAACPVCGATLVRNPADDGPGFASCGGCGSSFD